MTSLPPSVSPGCGLREQELLLLLRGGSQPHRGSSLLAARPVQGPGVHQSGRAGRRRAPEVLSLPLPHGRFGKLPAGLHGRQGQRRGPGHGPDQQHQVRPPVLPEAEPGRVLSIFASPSPLPVMAGGRQRKAASQLAAVAALRARAPGADAWLVYSWRCLDNRWHFKRASICCDNLCLLNLWPFECRLPYRCLTHSPHPLLSLCLLLPAPPFILCFSLSLASFYLSSVTSRYLVFLVYRFSIDPQSDPEALFRIAPDAGLITTAMELDREREHWHNITVIATQRGQWAVLHHIDPGCSLPPVRWIS